MPSIVPTTPGHPILPQLLKHGEILLFQQYPSGLGGVFLVFALFFFLWGERIEAGLGLPPRSTCWEEAAHPVGAPRASPRGLGSPSSAEAGVRGSARAPICPDSSLKPAPPPARRGRSGREPPACFRSQVGRTSP